MDYKKIKRKLKDIFRDSSRYILGKKNYMNLRFYFTHHYKLNLNNPKTWNEKIQYRKINCDYKFLSKFADKLTVRDYVEKKIGKEYLIPLLGIYKELKIEDFEKLPKSFVIKTSNGSGGENVKIIYDKSKEDLEEIAEQFNKYIKSKIGWKLDEKFYDIQEPYILVEKLLYDNGGIPEDYKIHFFEKEKYIIVQRVNRNNKTTKTFYDEEYNILDFMIYPKTEKIGNNKKPKNYIKMIELSKNLGEGFGYSRIDMYNISGKIYFGEITFCHGGGWNKIVPREWDNFLGEKWV